MWREKMLEALAEVDDAFMDAYLHGKEISTEMILSHPQGSVGPEAQPVMCGSAVQE